MIRVLFYLPTIAMRFVQSVLPRRLFIPLYTPSTDLERVLESKVRNVSQREIFYAKRAMRKD